jgi:membrane protein required for colicin V production
MPLHALLHATSLMLAQIPTSGSYLDSYIRVIDLVLGVMLIWGGYKGYKKGFVLEALSTLVFVIGMIIIFYLITIVFYNVKSYGYMDETAKPTSFIFYFVAFVALALGINAFGNWLSDKIEYSIFGDLDTFLGMALGILKYAIFLSTLIWILERVGYRMPPAAVADSQLYPLLRKFEPWLIEAGNKFMPFMEEMFTRMDNLLRGLKKAP